MPIKSLFKLLVIHSTVIWAAWVVVGLRRQGGPALLVTANTRRELRHLFPQKAIIVLHACRVQESA